MLVSGTFYTASTGSAGKRKEEDEDEEEEEEKEEWFEVGKVPATLQVGQNIVLAKCTHTTFKKHTWVG